MLNCIVIQGRFAEEPELRHTASNTAICSATLAVQRSRKDQNGEYPADFIPCVFWGKTAEHVSVWFHKGDSAIVRGRMESRKWQDKNGNNRVSWEVQAESIDFCGGKRDSGNNYAPEYDARSAQEVDDFTELPDDDYPPF